MTDEDIKRMIAAERRQAAEESRSRSRKRRITALCIALAIAAGGGMLSGYFIGRGIAHAPKPVVSTAEDAPLVNTAMAELGNKGGEKFWSWYGFSSYVPWCACFASWCEDQIGLLDSGKAPGFCVVSDGSDWFISRGQWLEAGATPQAGDLIFFDWQQDGARDHVGIVTAVVDDMVFTVEGNSSDRCRQKRYKLDDAVIYGYGRIEQ